MTGSTRAQSLRKRMTVAESRLWVRLRDRRLDGWKIRRQHPIGPFVADFFCEAANLVIEIDGGQHAAPGNNDARRTAYLERHGNRVIRFWNNDVLENIDGVLEEILRTLRTTPHPNPLPEGEGD